MTAASGRMAFRAHAFLLKCLRRGRDAGGAGEGVAPGDGILIEDSRSTVCVEPQQAVFAALTDEKHRVTDCRGLPCNQRTALQRLWHFRPSSSLKKLKKLDSNAAAAGSSSEVERVQQVLRVFLQFLVSSTFVVAIDFFCFLFFFEQFTISCSPVV